LMLAFFFFAEFQTVSEHQVISTTLASRCPSWPARSACHSRRTVAWRAHSSDRIAEIADIVRSVRLVGTEGTPDASAYDTSWPSRALSGAETATHNCTISGCHARASATLAEGAKSPPKFGGASHGPGGTRGEQIRRISRCRYWSIGRG
jgi:hypothetical protein